MRSLQLFRFKILSKCLCKTSCGNWNCVEFSSEFIDGDKKLNFGVCASSVAFLGNFVKQVQNTDPKQKKEKKRVNTSTGTVTAISTINSAKQSADFIFYSNAVHPPFYSSFFIFLQQLKCFILNFHTPNFGADIGLLLRI